MNFKNEIKLFEREKLQHIEKVSFKGWKFADQNLKNSSKPQICLKFLFSQLQTSFSILENLSNRIIRTEKHFSAKSIVPFVNKLNSHTRSDQNYHKDQEIVIFDIQDPNTNQGRWKINNNLYIESIFLMIPAPDPSARADALALRQQYTEMEQCWDQRHRRARAITLIMKIRSKILTIERCDFEQYVNEYNTWKVTLLPQIDNELKQLEIQCQPGVDPSNKLDQDLEPEVDNLRQRYQRCFDKLKNFGTDLEQGKYLFFFA